MNRFLSGTFDKEFANRYAYIRNNTSSKLGLTSEDDNLIVFKIIIPAGLRNIFYVEQENQVVFGPVVKFKIEGQPEIRVEKMREIYEPKGTGVDKNIENITIEIIN